jgi:hypothetical protein
MMFATLEVVVLPVSDPDKSLDFYQNKLGFGLDVDYAPMENFRVVQLTPKGSSTSVQFRASFADFTDPDGNSWTIQERGHSNG